MSSVLDFKRPIILEQNSEPCRVLLFRFATLGQLTKFVLILLCTLCSECEAVISGVDLGQSNPIHYPMAKIVKGKNAQHGGVGGHPYVVSIQYLHHEANGRLFFEPFCGGVILDQNTIITAAHCFDTLPGDCGEPNNDNIDNRCYRIVAGRHDVVNDLSTHQKIRMFSRRAITIHEDYNHQFNNDIALIHLDHCLEFDNFVQSIPLVTPDKVYSKTGMIVGFGSTWPTTYSGILQEANVTIYSDRTCEKFRWGIPYHKEGMICAGNDDSSSDDSSEEDDDSVADACIGDSGGPLVVSDYSNPTIKYLIGIISWGYIPCGSKGFPGIYTRVETYVDWIMKNRRRIVCRQWHSSHIPHNHHHHYHHH